MEKVSQHFGECDYCVNIYNEIIVRHNIAELVLGESIPLGHKLAKADKEIDVQNIVQTAINKIIDNAYELTDSISETLHQLVATGFTISKKFNLHAYSMVTISRTDNKQNIENQIQVQKDGNLITLAEGERLTITSDDSTASLVLITSEDGNYTNLHKDRKSVV